MDGNSSNLKETLSKIDVYIDSQREAIERGEALKRLKNTEDYKLVFADGYIKVEAERLFNILVDPSGASPDSPEEIQMKLASISHFKGYVGTDGFKGTIEVEAQLAPGKITMETTERSRVTAEYAEDGE